MLAQPTKKKGKEIEGKNKSTRQWKEGREGKFLEARLVTSSAGNRMYQIKNSRLKHQEGGNLLKKLL